MLPPLWHFKLCDHIHGLIELGQQWCFHVLYGMKLLWAYHTSVIISFILWTLSNKTVKSMCIRVTCTYHGNFIYIQYYMCYVWNCVYAFNELCWHIVCVPIFFTLYSPPSRAARAYLLPVVIVALQELANLYIVFVIYVLLKCRAQWLFQDIWWSL